MTKKELIERLVDGSYYCEMCEKWISGSNVEYIDLACVCKICGFELLASTTLNFFREAAGRLAEW